eukprot:TRINITY_DN1749_c0_g1_i1.p1 TRINITY_DN1749_c0_g1~~TRINITY_DN1749_c0_g1_i1.p1  ORF type:complete len:1119 (-),score=302.68 TRINITY_DN1749_c0_g1_i1:295-3651(-)
MAAEEAEQLEIIMDEEITEPVDLSEEAEEPVAGEEAAAEAEEVVVDTTAITEVQDVTFDEIRLPGDVVEATQSTWDMFLNSSSSREAAGEAIFKSIFESAPSLQSLFTKTPRAVMSMRFMGALNDIIKAMHQPKALKTEVETLGFKHLDLAVTVPRVVIFRDAILDLLQVELGPRFSSAAKSGWTSIMNYVGGAFIYIRREYAGRLKIIASSWRIASKSSKDVGLDEELVDAEGAEALEGEAEGEAEGEEQVETKASGEVKASADVEQAEGNGDMSASGEKARASGEAGRKTKKGMDVPTDFNGMFMFNAAVMGFGESGWMPEVLERFDSIVANIANPYRVQEECDTLSLTLAKYHGSIRLPEFKSVMLASLRSLVPKDWDGEHEIAWGWLWENVERLLSAMMGKPASQEKSLERLLMCFTEDDLQFLRREVYARFFALAPAGQDFFKQSTTRLYWIADKVVEMTMETYRQPKHMVDVISAAGLRHVGYGVPTEFISPYVTGAVEVIRALNADEAAEEAFRWSLSLVGRILMRAINEGSTIVMKAINTNSAKQLRKAVSCAPRAKRAGWLLNIAVGTQSISPLFWSIESGSLESARAMIEDLLTIRADRDNYYYGCQHMFERHPDIIQRLSADAVDLMPVLLDGLIWRSRVVAGGERRVNYYVKYLMVDMEGRFNQALGWLVEGQDPTIICHPVVVLFSDLIWSRIASRYFIIGKLWFIFTLVIFFAGQTILMHMDVGNEGLAQRIAMFCCRVFIYLGSMASMLRHIIIELFSTYQSKSYFKLYGLPIPMFLRDWREQVSLALSLTLLFMLTQEPIFWCATTMEPGPGDEQWGGTGIFTQNCPDGQSKIDIYTDASMLAMFLYWFMVIDLSIFSNQVSAYVLVCGRVLSEVFLFLGGVAFLILTFSSSLAASTQENENFDSMPKGALSLWMMAIGVFPDSRFSSLHEDALLMFCVCLNNIFFRIILINLLIAQLNGAYAAVYKDMVGYARLNRGKTVCEMMDQASAKRWGEFIASLGLDERLEFNEGDIGIAGGIQVLEPANANPTTIDMIKRVGGSTALSAPWPEEAEGDDDENKFDRLEKLIARVGTKQKTTKGGASGSSAGLSAGSAGEGSFHSE